MEEVPPSVFAYFQKFFVDEKEDILEAFESFGSHVLALALISHLLLEELDQVFDTHWESRLRFR